MKVNIMKIGSYTISKNNAPYIIAEMSGNHNQSLDRALELVEAAAKSGAHAIKLQTYTADTITLNHNSEHFIINDPKSLWNGRKLHELYHEAHTPWEWHKPIIEKAKECGIDCFSSPFDFTAVDFLETLNVPAYKVASFEITHLPLIEKCASTGKPLIFSTGMATLDEIKMAYQTAKNAGAKDIIILKCTSQYPANASDANLNTMLDMQKHFPDAHIGLSDHTLGIGVAVAATCLGARVIEKHFTLDRSEGGVDSAFSLEPHELKSLVEDTQRAVLAMGDVKYGGTENEKNSRRFRQAIWVKKDIKQGEIITENHLKICRPAPENSLSPSEYKKIIGNAANKNYSYGDVLEK
jgi:N-acetylneuraminate synthase